MPGWAAKKKERNPYVLNVLCFNYVLIPGPRGANVHCWWAARTKKNVVIMFELCFNYVLFPARCTAKLWWTAARV